MKVILTQDIKNLGRKGDIKDVAEGYARNFLLPKKLVEIATDSTMKDVEIMKKKESEEQKNQTEKLKKLAADLNGKEFVVKSKEKEGKLFGSVSKKDIAKVLSEGGFEIGEENILLEAPLKRIGKFEVTISFDGGASAKIKLEIQGI